MFSLLFQLFLCFGLINGDEKEIFNEALLMDQHHQNILKVNSYIDRFRQKINKNQGAQTRRPQLRTLAQEKAKDEEFLQYQITEVWWNGTIDEDHEITPQTSFLNTPSGHGIFPTEDIEIYPYEPPKESTVPLELQDIYLTSRTTVKSSHLPDVFMTRPTFPFPIITSEETDATSRPGNEPTGTHFHQQYPHLTPPKGFPSDYRYPTIYPPPPGEDIIPKDTKLTPKYSLFTLPNVPDRPIPTFVTMTFSPMPTLFPLGSDPEQFYTVTPTNMEETTTAKMTYTTMLPKISEHVMNWMQEESRKTARVTWGGKTKPQLRLRGPRSSRPLGIKHSQLQLRTPTEPDMSLLITTKQSTPASIFETPLGYVLFGNITVSTTPKPTTLPYQYVLSRLREGYVMVFLIELMALIALKKPGHVHDVITNTETVIKTLSSNFKIVWMGYPLMDVVMDLAKYASTRNIYIIQSHATIMYHLLLERRRELSAEVNSIIDYASAFYAPFEGKKLLDTVKEFGNYPNTTKDAYWMCHSLIETLHAPYSRILGEPRKVLADSINKAIKARFLQYGGMSRGRSGALHREPELKKQKEPQDETPPHPVERSKTKSNRQSKRRNRRRRHRKLNLKHTTESNTNIYRRQNRPITEIEYPFLRSLKPITPQTTIQRRYHIVTSKLHFRQRNVGTTTRNYVNLMTRPTKAMDDITRRYIRKPTPELRDPKYVSKVNYRRQMNADDDKDGVGVVESREELKDKALFYHQVKERFKALNEAKSVKLKAKLLRKIVEGSSYSDEEADLKMKLIQALLLENRSVEVGSDTTRK